MTTVKYRIADHFRMLIGQGELGAGAKLPTQSSVAKQFECSDVSVLNAYKALVEAGVVEYRKGDGYFVPEAPVRYDLAQLEHDQAQLDEPDPDDDLRPTIAWYNRRSKVIAKHKPCSFTEQCEIECVHGWVDLVVR